MSLPASPEQIFAANKAALDSVLSLINTSLTSVEKVVSLNLAAARGSLTDHVDQTSSLLAVRNLSDVYALQSAHAQPQLEKLLAYSRKLYDISSETQAALAGQFEARHAELTQSLSSLLDQYGKSSANSEAAVAAVKSALSAANSAYANVNKTARQVAEITEASVNAATSATARAVGTTAAQPRKKAA